MRRGAAAAAAAAAIAIAEPEVKKKPPILSSGVKQEKMQETEFFKQSKNVCDKKMVKKEVKKEEPLWLLDDEHININSLDDLLVQHQL